MPIRRVLLLGDICSGAGRRAVTTALPSVRRWSGAEFVIANAENLAGGFGISPPLCEELFEAGVDCITTGDHAFDRRDCWDYFDRQERILRPLNYPPGVPGRGFSVFERPGWKVGVVNLLGRVFMKPMDCPFRRLDTCLEQLRLKTPVIIVDFHAEATAEKQAMGWYLNGKVSAVIGTHTHVQTADEQVLPGGTGYITDAGMCGAFESVLGMRREGSIGRLLEGLPYRLTPASHEPGLNGVVIEIDDETGKTRHIERLRLTTGPEEDDQPETAESEAPVERSGDSNEKDSSQRTACLDVSRPGNRLDDDR